MEAGAQAEASKKAELGVAFWTRLAILLLLGGIGIARLQGLVPKWGPKTASLALSGGLATWWLFQRFGALNICHSYLVLITAIAQVVGALGPFVPEDQMGWWIYLLPLLFGILIAITRPVNRRVKQSRSSNKGAHRNI
jgi:hypothetical protein